jgi:hypothetical protein
VTRYWTVAHDQYGCPRAYGHASTAAASLAQCLEEVRAYQLARPDLHLTVRASTRHVTVDDADYDDSGPRTGR